MSSVANNCTERDFCNPEIVKEFRDAYREKTKNFKGRKLEFLKRDKNARDEILNCAIAGFSTGVVTGAIAGGIIGAAVGTPGGPPGMAVGAGVGALVGAGVGAAIGGGIGCAITYPRYKAWCETEPGKAFGQKFSIFLADERKVFENWTCPITLMPILDGVRTPDGRLYERAAIEAAVKKHGRNPMTDQPLRLEDLTTDDEANFSSVKSIHNLLSEKRDEIVDECPEVASGVDDFMQEMREWSITKGNQKINMLQKQFKEKKITYKEFQQKNKEIQKYYNI